MSATLPLILQGCLITDRRVRSLLNTPKYLSILGYRSQLKLRLIKKAPKEPHPKLKTLDGAFLYKPYPNIIYDLDGVVDILIMEFKIASSVLSCPVLTFISACKKESKSSSSSLNE